MEYKIKQETEVGEGTMEESTHEYKDGPKPNVSVASPRGRTGNTLCIV